jgi:hypothetical protein
MSKTVKLKTKKDIDCYNSTLKHKENVHRMMELIAQHIRKRGSTHDDSKLENPEFEVFSKYTPELAKLDYGSEEYNTMLEENLRPALENHYSKNDHHPEFYSNGIKDMSLFVLVEMLIDWYCSAKRQNNGNIRLSIEKNKERFGYSKELEQIFLNTIPFLESLEE